MQFSWCKIAAITFISKDKWCTHIKDPSDSSIYLWKLTCAVNILKAAFLNTTQAEIFCM